jgi:hypothetical protein
MTTIFHAAYWAHALCVTNTTGTVADLSRSIANARVDLNPHQVDAALFAVRSPLSRSVILADAPSRIRSMRFGHMPRCLHSEQRFQSDPERRFASLLECDRDVSIRWARPSGQDIHVYLPGGQRYIPDFVVETIAEKFLVEVKDVGELDDVVVQAKARAAVEWCRHATVHSVANGGKPWRYVLVPDTEIAANATLSGLVERFSKN